MQNDDDVEFRELLASARAGDGESALELIDLYGPYVLRAVRRRLPPTLRAKFDSTDFVQTVWAAFFCDERDRDFESAEELIRFLLAIVRNKLCDESRRRLGTQRYNVGREQQLDTPAVDDEFVDDQEGAIDLRQARPSQIAQARERWVGLLAQQPPLYRRIMELRCQGATFVEIAQQLQIHERTARRVFDRLFESQ